MKVNLTAYACMFGHVLYSEHNLALMLCPECMGAVKDKTLNDPRLLSVVQGSIIEETDRNGL